MVLGLERCHVLVIVVVAALVGEVEVVVVAAAGLPTAPRGTVAADGPSGDLAGRGRCLAAVKDGLGCLVALAVDAFVPPPVMTGCS